MCFRCYAGASLVLLRPKEILGNATMTGYHVVIVYTLIVTAVTFKQLNGIFLKRRKYHHEIKNIYTKCATNLSQIKVLK